MRTDVRAFLVASSGERAAHYVRQLIFDGELRPGDRVPQDRIATDLGMSKIPVREALVALEREGWVTLEPYRGVFVIAVDEEVVRDQFQLFALLFGFAARRCIEHDDAALLGELTRMYDALAQSSDPAEIDSIVYAFHWAIADGARSARLTAVLRGMSAYFPGTFFSLSGASDAIERREMGALLDAMRERKADAAVATYERLMYDLTDIAIKKLRDRGLFEEG
ncbi:MAG TPA: GntR family transcriptional regulator [Acidimicrobiia bacterium]|nr:GntR family transcriptional regulator [Acidimicrobiia bacterium]